MATGHGPKGERAGLRPRHARPAANLLYRFATRPCRQSWNTDAMTRRPVPAQQQQAQDQAKNASVRSGARARRVAPVYGLEAGAVTPDDREAVRQAGAGDARRPRAAAGLPERIEDPAVVALLAGLLREPGPAGVVRSGRCPACGYLYGSGGHQVSCELPASRTGERAYLTVVSWGAGKECVTRGEVAGVSGRVPRGVPVLKVPLRAPPPACALAVLPPRPAQ